MVEVSHCFPLFYSIGNGGPCAWHNMFAPPQKKSASFIAWGKIMIGYFLMNPTAALKRLSAFATFFGMLAVSVINSLQLFAQLGGDILWARKRLTQFHFLQGKEVDTISFFTRHIYCKNGRVKWWCALFNLWVLYINMTRNVLSNWRCNLLSQSYEDLTI